MEFNNKPIVIFSEHYNILFITVECCYKLRKNTMQINVEYNIFYIDLQCLLCYRLYVSHILYMYIYYTP